MDEIVVYNEIDHYKYLEFYQKQFKYETKKFKEMMGII
jgi:hypothetical protein